MTRSATALRLLSPFVFLFLSAFVGCDDGGGDPVVADCSVTMITPVAGDEFLSGEELNIRWESSARSDLVRVDMLRGGEVVGTLEEATANDGFLPWNATGAMGGTGADYSVRVTVLGREDCGAESGLFTIFDTLGCSFTFTSLDSDLIAGVSYLITWDSHHTTGNVDIGLFRWTGLIGDVAVNVPDTGMLLWEADSFHHGTDDHFWFEIRDHVLQDCSAESVHMKILDTDICTVLVTSPFRNEVWREGEARDIHFEQSQGSGRVDIILNAGQEFVSYIAQGYDAASGSFPWQVSSYGFDGPLEYFRIDIVDSDDSYCRGESPLFTIRP